MSEELDLDDLGSLFDADPSASEAGVSRPVASATLVRTFRPNASDPAEICLYPPTFPVELALQTAPLDEILDSYSISPDAFKVLQTHPVFVRDLAAAVEAVKKHGMSFKMKAGLQAEAMLERVWDMVHAPYDEVPPAVQADLMKFMVKAAGLDASKEQGANNNQTPLQIQINLR